MKFLDPMSPEGEELIELDTIVELDGQIVRSSGQASFAFKKVKTREKFGRNNRFSSRVDPRYEYCMSIENSIDDLSITQ